MKGFTFIEILVVIAIFSMIVGLGLFMSMSTFRGTIHRSEAATIIGILEKARSRAMNNINQASWGVCYVAPNYVIVKNPTGVCPPAPSSVTDSFVANPGVAAASDFTNNFPAAAFAQLTGNTTSVSFTIKEDGRPDTTVTLNNEGTIDW